MAEFSGIRNENEFYFAHYLSSLMDDELKEVCQSEAMKLACERLSKLGPDYHELAEARAQAAKVRYGVLTDFKAKYRDRLRSFVSKLAGVLGYDGTFTSPGTRLFHGANVVVPVSGILETKDGSVSAVLIESRNDAASAALSSDKGMLGNYLTSEQLAAVELPEASRRELGERVGLGRSPNQMPTWENLLSNEIFAASNPPRFVVVFGEDSILLADRTKWAERRTMIFELGEIYERGERATFRAMACLLSKSSIAPDGATPLPDKLDETSHKNAFGVSKSLRYAMREAIELLGNAILAGVDGEVDARRLSKECILVMYRFLFVLFLESRKDLGYFDSAKGTENIFQSAYGFDHLRDMETVPLLTEADRTGTYFDRSIKQLFSKIWKGAGLGGTDGAAGAESGMDAFRIQPLKAHLFDPERTPLFNRSRIPNEIWQRIIYSLSIGEAGTGRRRRKGRISYAQLGIQQLGAVYEALLSYTGFYAKEDLYEVQSAGTKGPAASDEAEGEAEDSADASSTGTASKGDIFDTGYFVTAADLKNYTNAEKVANADGTLVCHKKGSFIYRMAGRDRERSASYYTPEVLTRCLVRLAIKERVKDEMSADEVMRLTVCEPAMGSAAFLNETIDQLADIYLRKKQKELKRTIPIEQYAAEKARVKMVIADNNVFGVDLNPTAADLAEVSLWLGSIGGEGLSTGRDLDEPYIPWFGTQLKCGNSIIGCRREVVFRDGTRRRLGFDEPFPSGAVWHFLIPDEGMATKLDKVVKGIVGDEVANRLKKWTKAFALPDKKKNYSAYDKTWKRLATASEAINKIWLTAAEDIKQLDDRTRDDIAYFGHEPKASVFQDIKSKDRQLNTEISRDEYGNVDYSKSLESVTDYFRLKTILDLWCSLWFWPLDKTAELPTWEDFECIIGLLARNEFEAPGQQTFDFFGDIKMTTEGMTLANRFKADPTLANLYRLFPFAKTSQSIAERQHFLHWELEFAPIFKERGGFDLIVGNPPWVKVQWEEAGILSEYDPRIAVRKISAADTMALRNQVFEHTPQAREAYLDEYVATTGSKSFLANPRNYPELTGVQTNLYKYFLPLAFRELRNKGVASYIHPEGVYDDPCGGLLRSEIYPRLRLHTQFVNELKLFDIHHLVTYGLNVYGPVRDDVSFMSIAKLYHPSTLEDSLMSGETTAELPLERNTAGTWNTVGHPDRVVKVTDDTLQIFSSLYDESGTPSREARLPALYTRQFLDSVLKAFANYPRKMADIEYGVSVCWDETGAPKAGIIKRQTGFVANASEVIYSGPLFFEGNPIYKTARRNCRLNSDFDNVDLTVAAEYYRPRTNYVRAVDAAKYKALMAKVDGENITSQYRLFCRHMLAITGERSLISIFAPKGWAHINGVLEFTFKNTVDMTELTSTFGAWMSLPFDWFVRSTGKSNFHNEVARLLPAIGKNPFVSSRALLLNCLNRDYAEMWAEAWDEAYAADDWLSADPHLTKWADHFVSGKEWKWATPLRTQLDRRQALVELDVIVTKALGLSLDDLLLMYRVSFPTMRKYDADTYYDQNGRCVFSAKSGESYLSRKEWEEIKDMREGEFRKTITETVFSDEPTARTIVYKAPFFRKDREADYREAWAMLEASGGVQARDRRSEMRA